MQSAQLVVIAAVLASCCYYANSSPVRAYQARWAWNQPPRPVPVFPKEVMAEDQVDQQSEPQWERRAFESDPVSSLDAAADTVASRKSREPTVNGDESAITTTAIAETSTASTTSFPGSTTPEADSTAITVSTATTAGTRPTKEPSHNGFLLHLSPSDLSTSDSGSKLSIGRYKSIPVSMKGQKGSGGAVNGNRRGLLVQYQPPSLSDIRELQALMNRMNSNSMKGKSSALKFAVAVGTRPTLRSTAASLDYTTVASTAVDVEDNGAITTVGPTTDNGDLEAKSPDN